MENYHKLIIDNYKEIHDEASVVALEEFVESWRMFDFAILEQSSFVYKDDRLLHEALVIITKNNFVGHVHEHCKVVSEGNSTVIYSAKLHKFFRINNAPDVIEVDLDYHEGVEEFIKYTLVMEKSNDGIYTSRGYLVPEIGKRLDYVYKVCGTCEDVSDVTRYKRIVLLQ